MKDCFRIPFNLQFFAEEVKSEEENNDVNKNDDVREAEIEENKNDNKNVDEEVIKKKNVSEFLKGLGVDTEEDLQDIVSKHKEDEEKSLSKVEKLEKKVLSLTKKLAEEQKARVSYEAQIEALKMGVKADMLEDVVIIASAKVTEDKDIKSVLLEMKKSGNSVYFENNDKKETGGTTITRKGRAQANESGSSNRNDESGSEGSEGGSGIAARLFEKKKKMAKSHYWG